MISPEELTAEASDAVLLGFSAPEAAGYAATAPLKALPEPKAEALKCRGQDFIRRCCWFFAGFKYLVIMRSYM